MRIADLSWYDLPELTWATDAFWGGIAVALARQGMVGVPTRLCRDLAQHQRWRHPGLLLSQACGYDVLYDEAEHLAPIATPVFAIEGCLGPRYRSVLVVRSERPFRTVPDLRGASVVINEAASHSGPNALRPLVAPHAVDGVFFGAVRETGSHTDSVAAVQDGEADVACVDAVVLGLLRRHRPAALRGLRPLACTPEALAPPWVTSTRLPAAGRHELVAALRAVFADPTLAEVRAAMGLRDCVVYPASAYAELESFEDEALRVGYHELPAPRCSPLFRPAADEKRAGPRGSCL